MKGANRFDDDWILDAPVVLLQTSKELFVSSSPNRWVDLAWISKLLMCTVAAGLLIFLIWIALFGIPEIFKERPLRSSSEVAVSSHGNRRGEAKMEQDLPKSVVLILALTMGLDYYSTDQYQSSMPNMAVEFHVSQAAMGMSIIIHTVVLSVSILIAGPLSDHLGRRPLILLCQLVLAISSFCCAFADTFAWFMGARAFQGISAAAYSVILAMIRDCYEDETKRLAYTSMVVSVTVIGPLAAPMVGGLFASAFGWRSCFYTVAALTFLLFMISYRVLEETAPSYQGGSYFDSVQRVFFHSRRVLILVSLGICKGYFDIISGGSTFILQWHHQFNMTQASLLSTFFALFGFLGVLISSYSGKTPSEVFWSFSSLVALAGVLTILAGLQESSEVLFLCSISLGTMVLYPPYLALLTDFTAQLQDIAGLATSLGTSVAQVLSFALSVPGMNLAGVGPRQMMFTLGGLLFSSQVLCLALSHGAMSWKNTA